MRCSALAMGVAMFVGGASAHADASFSYEAGNRSALVTFSVSGATLTVTLWNTATVEVGAPSDVLTGVFFDIDDFDGALTRESALLTSTDATPILFSSGTSQPGLGYNNYAGPGDIGSEAGYRTASSASHKSGDDSGSSQSGSDDSESDDDSGGGDDDSQGNGSSDSGSQGDSDDSDDDNGDVGNHAIGLVGMDDFMGANTRFDSSDSHNLQGPTALAGIEYGLVNATYVSGGNAPINGPNALVRTGVEFTFGGFTGSELDIGNIHFNYGTEYNPIAHGETFSPVTVPAPAGALLGLLGLGMVGWMKRRFA